MADQTPPTVQGSPSSESSSPPTQAPAASGAAGATTTATTPAAPAQASTPAPDAPKTPTEASTAAVTAEPAKPAAEAPAAAEAAAPAEPAKTETFLGAEPPKKADGDPAKPAEAAKPAEGDKPAEGAETAPPEPPAYEAWTLPEGVTVDPERISDFNKRLVTLEQTGKLPRELTQKFGQELMDLGIAEVQTALTRQAESYLTAWNKQKSTWAADVQNDPQFKNRFDTALETIRTSIEEFAASPGLDAETAKAQRTEFRQLMEQTGAGNHRAQFRMIENMHTEIKRLRKMLETETDVKPLAGQKPQPVKQGKMQKFYGGSTPPK